MTDKRYLSAHEAADALGISLSTLYAYVSRGLIRSEASGESQRSRRYHAEDVEQLIARKAARHSPEKLAQSALHWGSPLLESAITLIADGRLYYRGHDAIALATTQLVEQVAALIWTGDLDQPIPALAERPTGDYDSLRRQLGDLTPVERFQVILPLAASADLAAFDLRQGAVVSSGARLLRLMTLIAAGDSPPDAGIAGTLQRAWVPDDPQAADLINAALILCADHELNVSSFTARAVASAGSTPYQVVLAGLSALQGIKHGGHTPRVEAFLREAGETGGVRAVIADWLKRGEILPGFRHPLYPDRDPRGALLVELVHEAYPDSPTVALAQAVIEQAQTLIEGRPNLDFGLALVGRALSLPAGGALALFALGRTIGWIGHALEQYAEDRLIRPRARYTGVQPGDE